MALALSLGLLSLAGLFVYHAVVWLLSTRRPPNFPPGPPSILGLGNLHNFPRENPFLTAAEWAKQYGPITGLKFGPTNVIVINDANLVYEFIVKRGAIFSGRPKRHVAQEHVLPEGREMYGIFLSNDYSRRLRTITKDFLVGSGLGQLAPMHQASATGLVYDLLQSGDRWRDHIVSWAVTAPVAMISGAQVHDLGDSWVRDYNRVQHEFEDLLDPATAPPIDIFPILQWVPAMFAEWKRKAPATRKALLKSYGALMAHAKKPHNNTIQPLATKLLQRAADPETPPEGRFSEQEITMLMGGTIDAAFDSSVVVFQILMLALAAHPEAQRAAQAEIDAVFGSETELPERIDLDRLPYVNACMTESLRWRPVSTLGLPRETVADEQMLGYDIPKGTTVMINMWLMNMDPDFYDEPDRFMPERYMRDPVGAKAGVSQLGRKAVYTFGAGRRECPGRDFVYQSMRMAMSQILWAFDVVPTTKLDLSPSTGFTSSVVLKPNPFGIKFVPRRPNLGAAVAEEKRKADILLRQILA
ncbi:cytochrome P450 [Lasiosphaeria ovina]|uniref:Cytochrome P450 n=1 Tax=Lasiosphaeria ovina TaxID=92902 RepID=A0AAE0NIR5_9PEZI|nr:cytochrome P450 [Lasiosphaeria ovina]